MALLTLCATAQEKRTTQATLYPQFKPSTIRLKDGRILKQPLTNVFLKNSSLVYLKGSYTMEANMDNIDAVVFDDRTFIAINKQLAYQVGESVGSNILYRIDIFDMKAYEAQLRNNVNISNLDLGDIIGVSTIDMNNEEDYKFPVFRHFYFLFNGEFVKVHERDLSKKLTKEGRTRAEQQMFQWTSRLLHWRQGNDVIIKGTQTQFIPYKGVYVIARRYQGKTALTILNGTSKPATMEVERYAEVIGSTAKAKDVLTNRYYDLSKNLELKPRQSLILEY